MIIRATRRRARSVGVVLGLAAAAVVTAWPLFWWWGPMGSPTAYALLALTPWAAGVGTVVGALALALRRWAVGAVALAAALVLAALVVPRAVADGGTGERTGPGTVPLVVVTANLQYGGADPAAVVALVRARHVDLLGLQELTPDAQRRLDEAGLAVELPHRVAEPREGVGGTGLVSRYPLSTGPALRPALLAQVSARADVAGRPVDVVVTHAATPLFRDPAGWSREITGLPDPATPAGPARLVMGDLNATLDHRPVRALLARGWSDAASAVGAGLVGTWPTDAVLPPLVAIDHVLASGPAVPEDVSTHRVPGTDHAALVVAFALPPGPVTPGP